MSQINEMLDHPKCASIGATVPLLRMEDDNEHALNFTSSLLNVIPTKQKALSDSGTFFTTIIISIILTFLSFFSLFIFLPLSYLFQVSFFLVL